MNGTLEQNESAWDEGNRSLSLLCCLFTNHREVFVVLRKIAAQVLQYGLLPR